MKKIGAKNTSKAKYRGTAYKCDLCGRKFMSVDALKSHQRSVHNLQPNKSRVKDHGKQAKKLEVKEKPVKKAVVMEAPVRTPIRNTRAKVDAPVTPLRTTRAEKVDTKPQAAQNIPIKTVEFECPKCFKSFHTYILAARHIQKFHCIDKKGGKVSPHSATIIQPERKELCLKCNRKVKSIPSHICDVAKKVMEEEGLTYNCTACETIFNNKRSFYSHVITSHSDSVESLFFPTNIDFVKWKDEMEAQTNTRYSELDKFDSKCYYHCDYQSGNEVKASINICPSVMVIQEFTKGIQVHYYKKHFKHGTKEYKLLKKYKRFSITDFLNASNSYFDFTDIKYDDNDMYVQFKKLMESIVLDAAKLKMDTLTVLFGKALEMTTILTGYDDDMSDDGSKPIKRNISDSQIVKELEETTNNENIVEYSDEPDIKKFKNNIEEHEGPSPMILNSFSLADKPIKENNKLEQTEILSIKVKDISSLQATSETKENSETFNTNSDAKLDAPKPEVVPSSFNESYADFLEKNFPEEQIGKRRSDRRNVMKTKIGQYKPPSPKKVLSNPPQEAKVKPVIPTLVPKTTNNNNIATKRKLVTAVEEQNKRKLNTSTHIKEKKQAISPVIPDSKRKSIRAVHNSKHVKETPKPDTKQKSIKSTTDTKVIKPTLDSKVIKSTPDTKVIKPTPDTKVVKAIKPKPRTIEKIKVDIEYEVKEREDDCNILILKI